MCNCCGDCVCTVEPLLRGHPEVRPPPLERPLDNVNLNINVLISTSDERPPLLKGHFSGENGVAWQEGFHCIQSVCGLRPNWLVGCVLRPINSEVIQRWHPLLLSLGKDVKLSFYTGPSCGSPLHYRCATPAPSKAKTSIVWNQEFQSSQYYQGDMIG